MPTYAYACRDCGSTFEVHQAFSDASLTVCPTCGGTLRKQYGSVGVTFNGSGFYRTDSRAAETKSGSSESGGSSSGGSSGGAASGEGGSSTSSTAAKSDAKPASTPASSSSTPS